MASTIPRNHFLYTHDALRKLFGSDAGIAAFVTQRKPYQCDMVCNHRKFADNINNNNVRQTGRQLQQQQSTPIVREFTEQLQHVMPMCTLSPSVRRVDIMFPDSEVIQLALGPPNREGATVEDIINLEPDWQQRNQLRIAFGYDEELFTTSMSLVVTAAAQLAQRRVLSRYKAHTPMTRSGVVMEEAEYALLLPPLSYWQVHAFCYSNAFLESDSYRISVNIIECARKYYRRYPFMNPYCDGEDLDTMEAVKYLHDTAWRSSSISW